MEGNYSSNVTVLKNSTKTFRSRPKSMSNSISAWDNVAYDEWSKFQLLHDRCINIFDKIETTLLVLGLFGNLLAFVTLLKGRHMRTPSFVYHKALVFAYLIYCLNFLLVKCVNTYLTVPSERRQLSYYNPLAAYYAVILNRVITSCCGYLALYTSLAISVDRFFALVIFKRYAKFNRHQIAYMWVGLSLLISVLLHSWAPWLENEIRTTTIFDRQKNSTVTTYRHTESGGRVKLKPYLMAKDWYNLIIRFVYALLLIVLTSTVIYMFAQQQKKRRTLCHVSKRQLRRERSLFYLMISVVIMAYIQVIPRESKRVLELIYPPEFVAKKIEDDTLSIGLRRVYLLFGLYGYTFTTPILNLCTTIERSLLFYLYFALNHSFRREVLILLKLKQLWHKLQNKLGLIDEEDEDERRRREFENTQRSGATVSDFRSPASTMSQNRLGSDASYYGAAPEYGKFLSPNLPIGRRQSRCGSFQTMSSEYSSVV